MDLKWCNPEAEFERLVLAIDVGGTNTNIGLVAYKEGKFTLVLKADYASGNLSGLEAPITETLHIAAEKRADLKPSQCRRARFRKSLRHDKSLLARGRKRTHHKTRHSRSGRQ